MTRDDRRPSDLALLARERARFEPERDPLELSTWERLEPAQLALAPPVVRLRGALDDPGMQAELATCEADERYPRAAVERLRRAGWLDLVSETPGEGCPAGGASLLTATHLSLLNAMTARRDGTLGITIGVQSLALLPVWLGGSPAQQAWVFGRMREGASSALLLTELPSGSNLLSNEARAEPGRIVDGAFVPGGEDPTHYLVRGEKHLINGAREHELLITLLRTRDGDAEASLLRALSDHSLLVIDRDATCVPLHRWATHPMRAADISGVAFEGTLVPVERRLGVEGAGFGLVKHTLTISRGGISSLAAGTSARARDLALRYARRRELYGAPIAQLGAIAGHLLRLEALELVVSCVALRSVSAVNAYALRASWSTAVAKLAACELAEEAVREGARVLSARALVEELPYARLLRDVTLYPVFDGTRHVMLDELANRLAGLAARPTDEDPLAEARARYAAPPRRLVGIPARRVSPWVPNFAAASAALAALPGERDLSFLPLIGERLIAAVQAIVASGEWEADQDLRFAAAAAAGSFCALLATVELADPDRRAALDLPPALPAEDPARAALVARFAPGWLGARVAEQVEALATRAGLEPDATAAALARRGEGNLLAAYREALTAALPV